MPAACTIWEPNGECVWSDSETPRASVDSCDFNGFTRGRSHSICIRSPCVNSVKRLQKRTSRADRLRQFACAEPGPIRRHALFSYRWGADKIPQRQISCLHFARSCKVPAILLYHESTAVRSPSKLVSRSRLEEVSRHLCFGAQMSRSERGGSSFRNSVISRAATSPV